MVSWFSKSIVAMTIRMPKWFVGWVSRRYVAGPKLDDAVNIMKRLSKENACFTVDVLGEEITTLDEAQFFLDEYLAVVEAIRENNLDANLSIKPTAFGLLIDEKEGMKNIETLVRMAKEHDLFVRLDMEDYRVTTATIQVVLDLHKQGLTNVGTVLQGRLFRTLDDINYLETELGPAADYRICKGIYLESEDIAYTSYTDIVDATNACIDRMLAAGSYCSIASHDIPVVEYAKSALWGQISLIRDKMQVLLETLKVPAMNFKCCLVCVDHCGESWQRRATGLECMSPMEKNGMNTAFAVSKKTLRLELKWRRHLSCHGPIGPDQFRGRFFLRLFEGVTPFLTTSFERIGLGLKPSLPSFHACLRSLGVRGAKWSGLGGTCKYIRLMSRASTVPRRVLARPM